MRTNIASLLLCLAASACAAGWKNEIFHCAANIPESTGWQVINVQPAPGIAPVLTMQNAAKQAVFGISVIEKFRDAKTSDPAVQKELEALLRQFGYEFIGHGIVKAGGLDWLQYPVRAGVGAQQVRGVIRYASAGGSVFSITMLRGGGQEAAQDVELQQAAASFHLLPANKTVVPSPKNPAAESRLELKATGTGFFITEEGFLITNAHVVRGGAKFQIVTHTGTVAAKVVKVDAANDLALLKAEGRFASLPVTASRGVRLGNTVFTVGFPNIGLQGFAPKLAKGEIAALSGAHDDARYFQISVPVQPGNSGGPLVNDHGNAVGVVSAKLSASAAFATSGALPENVNYGVKSSFLLSFLESVPDVAAKLKDPNTKDTKFEDVVRSAEQATVLVLIY
jgi:S1-C subfamily serine protease